MLASKMNTHIRDNLNAVGPIVKLYKTADESVTSSITLQNDDHLVFAIAASEVWVAEYTLFMTGASTGDFQYAFTVPAGATGIHGVQGATATTSDATSTLMTEKVFAVLTSAPAVGTVASGTLTVARIYLQVTNSTTAGNVTLQWAQAASDVTATTVKAGSWLFGIRMSP